jgi:myo-inositol 2-dehydrogenase/D-chiro-inositol 1-dehydrogenase
MSTRVGVIGTGIMGADHAQILQRFVSGAELVLVADVDLDRAERVAGQLGCRATSDPLALIDDVDVDAVLVASHDATHAEFVLASVRAGKPVLCEKPLAPTLAEAVELMRAVGDQVALLSLGFMRRFDPGYAALKAQIQDGSIGRPLRVHSVGRGVSTRPGWTDELSVTSSAIHDLDIVPWLLESPVVEVAWLAGRSAVDDFHDPQLILLRTADGSLSTVDIFLNARYGYDMRCEVVGDAGTASIVEPVRVVTETELTRLTGYAPDWRPRFAEAYRLEQQAWVDRINGMPDDASLATAHDGLVASAVADAVITSMHTGGVAASVAVPEV